MILRKNEQTSKECDTLGLAISPVSLLFCNYLVCTHKYVVELRKEIEKNIKTKIANAKIA